MLEAKPKSEDPDEAAEDKVTMKAKWTKLAKVKEDVSILKTFFNKLNSQWDDIMCLNIGHIDWIPKISVNIKGHCYTKDIGTFKVETVRLRPQFKSNVVDLGAFCLIFS